MDETYQILLGLRERYEAHHKLRYTDEALDAAAKYSHQYISDRWVPEELAACCTPHAYAGTSLACLMACAINFPAGIFCAARQRCVHVVLSCLS